MYLSGGRFRLRRGRRTNWRRAGFLLVLIAGALYLLRRTPDIPKPFIPTPTPTRSAASYAGEAEAQFAAGRLDEAIAAYRQAILVEPKNLGYYVALSRLLTYSSATLATEAERRARLEEAIERADTAVLIDPNSSQAHAVRALALDWAGQYDEASNAVVRAIQLDANNPLALAYYAEILTDQQKWAQAVDVARQAVDLAPNSLDTHRTYAYVLESTGNYQLAVAEYQEAVEINPNLAFLYMSIGANYRRLGDADTAIEYFQRASALNPKNPIPFLAISRTYYQLGEFGSAAEYARSALKLDPTNADIHGRLGLVYFQAKNYEGSVPELACAVRGCTLEGTGEQVIGLPLTAASLEYYYTYGSVLAALSTPQNNQCAEALAVFSELLEFAQDDEIVKDIADEGITICNRLAEATSATGAPSPTATP